MEIGQYAIRSVNLTLRPCSLQCICSHFNPIKKQNIAVKMCSLIGCLGLMAPEHEKFSSHLFDALSNWLHSGDHRVQTSAGWCWSNAGNMWVLSNLAVFKPTVLDERLMEEQKDVFEMWGALSSSESHFFFFFMQAWSCGKCCCVCKVRQWTICRYNTREIGESLLRTP